MLLLREAWTYGEELPHQQETVNVPTKGILSEDCRNGKTTLPNIRGHLCQGYRTREEFSGGLDGKVASHPVRKTRPPRESKQRICSCCTYTSAGTEPVCHTSETVKRLLTMPVVINKATEIKALLDSGASSNFMHQDMAKRLKLELQNRKEPQPVKDIQGGTLGWISKFVRVHVGVESHQETINFNIIPLGLHGVVLGLPWLQKHDPEIKWTERKIKFNSLHCKQNCIRKEFPKLRNKKETANLGEQILKEEEVNSLTLNPM